MPSVRTVPSALSKPRRQRKLNSAGRPASRLRRRLGGLLLIPTLAVPLIAAVSMSSTAAADVPLFSNRPVESADFAETTWNDAWDFSNSTDILLDRGPSMNISAARIAGGNLSYTIGTKGAYISPLWAGYPGSLYAGRDGALAANQINASVYTHVHLHAYASALTSAGILWFRQDGQKAQGGMSIRLQPGWHDYDLTIKNSFHGGQPWAGRIHGLRIITSSHHTTRIAVDFMRLYQPSAAATVSWRSPNGRPATLFWATGTGRPTTATATGGPVLIAGKPATASGNTATRVNLGGYPGGTTFYAVSAGRVVPYSGVPMAARPNIVVDSPSAAGCGDWATRYLGRPWTFTSARTSLTSAGNAALRYGSALSGTNTGPIRNDPHINLKVGGGIDGRVYHRLTIVEGYDGAFNLANAAGGGTMARVMWTIAGKTIYSQTNDLLTYSGKRSITVNLAMPTATLTEPDGAQRYAFASPHRVTALRWDPNEDPGARHWRVYSVRLAADCATRTTFAVTWHDLAFARGATATVLAYRGAKTYVLGTVAEKAGANSFTVNSRRLPVGAYNIRIIGHNGGAAAGYIGGSTLAIVR